MLHGSTGNCLFVIECHLLKKISKNCFWNKSNHAWWQNLKNMLDGKIWKILFSSYFRTELITLHPSMPLASYFRANHSTLHPSIRLVSYFRANHLTLHPSIGLVSYFRADHLALHPYIHLTVRLCIRLASCFCYVHPYIGMVNNILLWIHLMFIWAPIVMYWMIVETEENQNSLL